MTPSKLSDQWLFVSSNLSARSLPKLVQIRLAEAAAASYALANGSAEVDENFCLDARTLVANRMDASPESVDFATECCDLLSFDTLGSDVCFPSWPLLVRPSMLCIFCGARESGPIQCIVEGCD